MARDMDFLSPEVASQRGTLPHRQSIEGLQYLRGLAALMVVFHHARGFYPLDSMLRTSGWSEVGSRGVDIFFVISGFVMAYSTRNYDPSSSRTRQAIDFFVKRVIRVVPLYWIALLWDTKRTIWKGEANLDLAKDFFFIPHFNDKGLIWPHLFQGWTINYEMFFYVLFALSMLVGSLRFVALSLVLVALTLIGVIVASLAEDNNTAVTIFYTSNLMLEFVMGIWLYLWMRHHPMRLQRSTLALLTTAGLFVLAIPSADSFRGLADGLAAVVIVWSTVLWASGTELAWLRRLGDASYSIYLFHMAIVGMAWSLFRSLGLITSTGVNIPLVTALYVVLATTLGFAVHYLIERPMLRYLGDLKVWASKTAVVTPPRQER